MSYVIASESDLASLNIRDRLLEEFAWHKENQKVDENFVYSYKSIKLVTIKTEPVASDHLEQTLDQPKHIIFLSRHRSESKKPSLLTHSVGNWGETALAGGRPFKLSRSSGTSLKLAYLELLTQTERLNLDIPVTLEVTHHGPYLPNTTVIFVEIGSTKEEWQNPTYGKALAHCAMRVALRNISEKLFFAIGVGGNHYANRFNKVLENTPWCVAYIVPKHALDDLKPDMLEMAVRRAYEPIDAIIYDHKGTNSFQREKIREICAKLDLDLLRANKL
ncbi:MAG: D-aminoacyl-tRNA deacylase [Promethearchaeota archaeon]